MKRTLGLLTALLLGCTAIGGAAKTKIGAAAPEFTLTDTNGKTHSLSQFKGKHVVLEWINHGCPFVKKHYESGNMQALQTEFAGKDVVWLSIASSAEGKEGYLNAGEWNAKNKEVRSGATAILLDAEGTVGKQYGAKTTPHMYIVDPKGMLIYQGAIDDKASTDQADVKGAKNYVREALNESLAGKPVTAHTTQAYGCSVKYKK
jgi:peroxiredoxin